MYREPTAYWHFHGCLLSCFGSLIYLNMTEREHYSATRKKFYHSKRWLRCRQAYGASQHWLCERCGQPADQVHHRIYLSDANLGDPEIALNWENLELLCDACHAIEHHGGGFQTADGLIFNEEGDLVQRG